MNVMYLMDIVVLILKVKKVRFVHELAWQQHYVTNMFIRPQNRHELLICALDPILQLLMLVPL